MPKIDPTFAFNAARHAVRELRAAASTAYDHRQDDLCRHLNYAANTVEEEVARLVKAGQGKGGKA